MVVLNCTIVISDSFARRVVLAHVAFTVGVQLRFDAFGQDGSVLRIVHGTAKAQQKHQQQ